MHVRTRQQHYTEHILYNLELGRFSEPIYVSSSSKGWGVAVGEKSTPKPKSLEEVGLMQNRRALIDLQGAVGRLLSLFPSLWNILWRSRNPARPYGEKLIPKHENQVAVYLRATADGIQLSVLLY